MARCAEQLWQQQVAAHPRDEVLVVDGELLASGGNQEGQERIRRMFEHTGVALVANRSLQALVGEAMSCTSDGPLQLVDGFFKPHVCGCSQQLKASVRQGEPEVSSCVLGFAQ